MENGWHTPVHSAMSVWIHTAMGAQPDRFFKNLFVSDYSDIKALRALSRHGAGLFLTEVADPAHFILSDVY